MADQRASLIRYASERNYTVVREYVDEGISGDATEKRVGFLRMLADVALGDFSLILCWDQDRFGRFDSVEAGFYLYPLRKARIILETIGQGRIDWTDFAGRLIYTVQQEAKHAYLRDLSRNVGRGMSSSFAAGKWQGGTPPYGYRLEEGVLVIFEDEAKIVRELYARYFDGESLRELAGSLNTRGVPSPRGTKWAFQGVRQVLLNEMNTGVAVWNRRNVSKYGKASNGEALRREGSHPAIIDADVFARFREMLSTRRNCTTPKARTQFPFLFSGLLVCGACGHKMYGRFGWKDRPAYVCSNKVLHQVCDWNWVYQDDLLEKFLSMGRSVVRPADLAVESELRKTVAQPSNAKQSLASVDGKLARAQQRLIEVDRDMIPIVQKQIRELQAEQRRLRATQTKPKAQSTSEVLERAALIGSNADPADMQKEIRKVVQSITVRVSRVPNGKAKPVYTLSGADLVLMNGATIKLV